MPSSSVIVAVEMLYNGLSPTLFPGSSLPPLYFDEAPVTGTSRISPPYVLLHDDGGIPEWTFVTDGGTTGQNAISHGSFWLEVFAFSLGDCDTILQAILWGGQVPNLRAGLAFATLDLSIPYRSMTVMPDKDQRKYTGLQYQNQRVHSVTQEFKTMVSLSGDGK